MKKAYGLLPALCLLLSLTACKPQEAVSQPAETPVPEQENVLNSQDWREVVLSDQGITLDGQPAGEEGPVFVSHDIIYYEDRDTYDSGHAYGEGESWEKHTAQEAAAHTVVNITQPGTYRLSGKLSQGQIRVDLGEEAFTDPQAVVCLVLADVDITCTVAPAILFLNVYECDNQWEENTPTWDVDTAGAGANLLLEGENTVNGSHVARIYKDGGEEKKLWKQDGAIYSYMSMRVSGPGGLELTADNEGMDTELHLTVEGGNIRIFSGNDGINTNEDGVSVTTINGGDLRIFAGLGEEGDGIDSNGWLVINGGSVFASANPAADAGLDSDMGSYINGGTVIALGSAMDWAESNSGQAAMNLQFAQRREAQSVLTVLNEAGETLLEYDPSDDVEDWNGQARAFQGAILSCEGFAVGETYRVQINGTDQSYTGTDVQMRPGMGGGFGGMGGQRPQSPEGMENMTPPEGFTPGQPPEGMENMTPPEGFTPGQPPEGMENMTPPEGWGGMGRPEEDADRSQANSLFYMQDKVNFFSGVADKTE